MNIDKKHLDNLLPFCSRHQGIPIKFGCVHLDCSYCILLCPDCVEEDDDHIEKHRAFIFDFKTFVGSLAQEISSTTKDYGVFLTSTFEKLYNSELIMNKTIGDFVQKEKEKIISEMSDLLTLIVERFEVLKLEMITYLEKQVENFKNNVFAFKSQFSQFNPKDNYQQFSDPLNIKRKIIYKSPIQTLHFLTYLRKYANAEGDLVKSMANMADKIQFHYQNPPQIPNNVFVNLKSETESLYQKIKTNLEDSFIGVPYYSENYFTDISEKLLSQDHKNILLSIKHNMAEYDYNFEVENIIQTNHNNSISQLIAITDEIVATSSFDRKIKIWNIHENLPILIIHESNSVCALNCIYNFEKFKFNKQYITTRYFKQLKGKWDKNRISQNNDYKPDQEFDSSLKAQMSISEGIYLLSGGFDRRVKLWNFDLNTKVLLNIDDPFLVYCQQNSWITIIKSMEDGRNFISGDDSGELIVCDILTGDLKSRLAVHNKFVTGVKIIEPFKSMVSFSGDAFRVWRLIYTQKGAIRDLDQIYCEKTIIHTSDIYSLSNCSFYPNFLFISGTEGIMVIYDLDNNSYLHAFKSVTPKENFGDFLVLENKATVLLNTEPSFPNVSQNYSAILTKSQLMKSKNQLKPIKPAFLNNKEHNLSSLHQKVVLLVVGLRSLKILDLNGNILGQLIPSESNEDFSFHNILSGRNMQFLDSSEGNVKLAIASQFTNQYLDYKSARITIVNLKMGTK